jgi:hypothetical protein
MTQAQLESLKNTLLASGQPITAVTHRNWAQKIIDELYNAASRGKVIATTSEVISTEDGDSVLIVRGGDTKLVNKDALNPIYRAAQDTSPGVIFIDFNNRFDAIITGTSPIESSKTIAFDNASLIRKFVFLFEITTTDAYLNLQSNVLMKASDPRWNPDLKRWTSDYATGVFKMDGLFNGTYWFIEISESNFI